MYDARACVCTCLCVCVCVCVCGWVRAFVGVAVDVAVYASIGSYEYVASRAVQQLKRVQFPLESKTARVHMQ